MHIHRVPLFWCLALASSVAAAAPAADLKAPAPAEGSVADRSAINAVVDAFRLAIIKRDGRALSELVVDPLIPFSSIDGQEAVERRRTYNAKYNGFDTPGFPAFARFVSESKVPVEERFKDVDVRIDGPMGLVTFEFEFVENGKLANSGLEHWVMRKIDGKWKIMSVNWTSRQD